jgi:hypothetical protein
MVRLTVRAKMSSLSRAASNPLMMRPQCRHSIELVVQDIRDLAQAQVQLPHQQNLL